MAQQRRRRERGSISVDEILNGAFAVAADVSIDNLSMPLLARNLDVGVTSIYWYFRKKDELQALVVQMSVFTFVACTALTRIIRLANFTDRSLT
jgi:AcrR family transcriptional regulator